MFLKAQERVKSLSIRQFEIEESIRNGLKYYLEPKDYVLRVKLFGEERAISVANETLPGFGQLNEPSSNTGSKYWEIKRMRVDLVMHKEVSPSVSTYIGEIVPILSGIDYERGDELVFVPILPSEPFPQQPAVNAEEELPDAMAKQKQDKKSAEKARSGGRPIRAHCGGPQQKTTLLAIRKRRHRQEALRTIFEEINLTFDTDDDRMDSISDVSSEDEIIYNPDYQRDYTLSKSNASCNLNEILGILGISQGQQGQQGFLICCP